jgi:N-dimethylarginine dimethylaminohydrolase
MSAIVISSKKEWTFNLNQLDQISLPKKVLMVTPRYFNIDTPINAHMLDSHGQPHHLDKAKAQAQWEALKKTYESLGFSVDVVEGGQDLPDMVFCANQSFPFVSKNGERCVVMSNMNNDVRHKEVAHIESFFRAQGYRSLSVAPRTQHTLLEGMGDVAWLGQKRMLLGGYGFRTNKEIYQTLASLVDCPIAVFELKNPKFYHLDTCLSILNSTTALVCKEAFTSEGFELLQTLIPNLILVPLSEADAPGFACNAHCPDEKHVILQKGSSLTCSLLKEKHFVPVEVETSEFIKSGGSVYCMKMMFF